MKAVILAAGRGERMKPYTDYVPKPLLRFKGKPLVDHVVSALWSSGVERVLVVTGYMGDAVGRHLARTYGEEIDVVHNPGWATGNASSLMAARRLVAGDDFVLSMCDHIYSSELVSDALAVYAGEPTLCVDREPLHLNDLGDATKVRVDDEGYVKAIGKGLRKWNAVDTGVFILPATVFKVGDSYGELSDLMGALCGEKLLRAFDATGSPWIDLDTADDLASALEVAYWV